MALCRIRSRIPIFPFFANLAASAKYTKERHASIMLPVLDLHARNLGSNPSDVDLVHTYFGRSGYYFKARHGSDNQALDQQLNLYGGLRWRFKNQAPN
tara:strand:+ start:102 stop:395 length:294 start_codon:yes stop_codon:yes gene_type:complete